MLASFGATRSPPLSPASQAKLSARLIQTGPAPHSWHRAHLCCTFLVTTRDAHREKIGQGPLHRLRTLATPVKSLLARQASHLPPS
jgi:hypothetical protein